MHTEPSLQSIPGAAPITITSLYRRKHRLATQFHDKNNAFRKYFSSQNAVMPV